MSIYLINFTVNLSQLWDSI